MTVQPQENPNQSATGKPQQPDSYVPPRDFAIMLIEAGFIGLATWSAAAFGGNALLLIIWILVLLVGGIVSAKVGPPYMPGLEASWKRLTAKGRAKKKEEAQKIADQAFKQIDAIAGATSRADQQRHEKYAEVLSSKKVRKALRRFGK